jgi:hypothetical protein
MICENGRTALLAMDKDGLSKRYSHLKRGCLESMFILLD